MIKFLHAADLHLDSPFHGLSPAQAKERRTEQRELLTSMVELANGNGCDLLLLSGDLFDSDNAYPETVEALCRALGAFRGQVFIAPGNHDCLYAGSPYFTAPWTENVHIFKEEKISSVTLPDLGCQVYGAGFTAMDAPPLLEGFRVEDDELLNLMVLHGEAETVVGNYNPMTKEQIERSGLDYLALGHVHLRTEGRTAGRTVYAYPGCPMGRGFDELGEKGVYLGELDEKGCRLTFLPLPCRRYEILHVAAGDDALAAIEAALPADTQNDIYRIYLTGQSDPIDLRALQEALAGRFYALHLRDKTEAKTDLWKDAGEESLKGQFLARLQEKLATADENEKAVIYLAARLGIYAMEGREEDTAL